LAQGCFHEQQQQLQRKPARIFEKESLTQHCQVFDRRSQRQQNRDVKKSLHKFSFGIQENHADSEDERGPVGKNRGGNVERHDGQAKVAVSNCRDETAKEEETKTSKTWRSRSTRN
jgi:hypothetical protein